METEIEIEKDIIVLTTKTVEFLLSKNPDSLSLYLFYTKNAKMQKTNQIWSTDTFGIEGLKWGKIRYKSAKDVLLESGLLTPIQKRDSKGRVVKTYIKLNYIHKYQNPQVDETASSETAINALSNKKEMLKVIKDKCFEETIVSKPNQEEIKDSSLVEKDNDDTPLVSLSVPTKLPDHLGKNPSLRFIEAYRKLYKRKFGVEYSVTNFAKTMGQASQFLKNKTELQALMMLDYYFIWHGGSAKDVRENEFLHNKFFPLGLFYSKENELKTFIINHEHIDYDDPEKVYKFAVDNFPTLFPKEN